MHRFIFVDALRGIAAGGVLLHHLFHGHVLEPELRLIFPTAIAETFKYGAYGVQIFFVLSGFVIAHSLRDFESPKQVLRFIMRRQIRLDLPYWSVIVAVLSLNYCEAAAFPMTHAMRHYDGSALLANMFYLQNVLRVPQIVGVSWTLCIEIQFYLAFILFLWIGRQCPKGIDVGLLIGSGLLSLAFAFRQEFTSWFASFWVYFIGGVMAHWASQRRIKDWPFYCFTIFWLAAALLLRSGSMAVGSLTGCALFIAARISRIAKIFEVPMLKYLGKISYSLYLVHLPIISIIMRAGYKLTGGNAGSSLGWFFLAATLSVGAAELFYKTVERPSLRLSGWFKCRFANVPIPTSSSELLTRSQVRLRM